MKKTFKKIVAVVLAVLMLVGNTFALPGLVDTGDTNLEVISRSNDDFEKNSLLAETVTVYTVLERINDLTETFNGKYFTRYQTKCTTLSPNSATTSNGINHDSCSDCKVANIVQTDWFKNTFNIKSGETLTFPYGTGTYSCHGFVNVALWYIFKTKNTDKISMTQVNSSRLTFSELIITAKPGDYVRVWYDGRSSHSLIFISGDSNGAQVLDSNGKGCNKDNGCKVQNHYITYINNPLYTFNVVRANNYNVNDISFSEIENGKYYVVNDSNAINVAKDEQSTGSLNASNSSKNTFSITKDGDYYKIVSTTSSSDFVVNVWATGISTNGAEVTLYKNTGGASQRWYFEECGDGYLIHPADALYLSLTRDTSTNKLYVKTTTKADNQIWKLEKETIPLSTNTSKTATISTGGEMVYYEYTPTSSRNYVIYSTSSSDTRVYLYDENLNEITSDDDSGDGTNFCLIQRLTAGTKYIFGIGFYNSSVTGDIPFKFGRVYTITYDANGGTGAPVNQTKLYGKSLTLSNVIPTRNGYTFKGWSEEPNGDEGWFSEEEYNYNASLDLYAVWEANTYRITYNANGGTGAPSAQTKVYGENLTLSNTKPTRSGYTFKGWSTSANGNVEYTAGATYSANRAVTLYAVWEANSVSFSTSMQVFLNLEGIISMSVGYKFTDMDSINPEEYTDKVGLLVWKADEAPEQANATYENCSYIIEGARYNSVLGRFESTTNGIVAKELGDALCFRAYCLNDDGTYSYSKYVTNFSPKTYCYGQIKNNPDNQTIIELMASILNYGAAAQKYFGYRTDDLMNSDLPDELK